MNDELTELLATGERAAFHGRPAAGIGPLQQAVELALSTGQQAEATAAAWLLGVCLGAGGRYGAAIVVLEPLAVADPAEADRRLFCSLAGATLASVHRQLGRHADAAGWDQQARQLAGDAAEAVFDAELGLAADAIGLADIDVARAHLTPAAELAYSRPDWWRQRVRLEWVLAELALLCLQPQEAAARAAAAVALAETSGAPRHVAKGLLFSGVAQLQSGDLDLAAGTLRRAASLAESLGAVPLVWPARAMLGALVSGSNPAEGNKALVSARAVVRQLAAELPDPYATDFLARADIVELLA